VSRRALVTAAALAAAALAFPASAAAHGIAQRADLPIPEWLFGWGAAMVLIISFVGLAVLWRTPQLQEPHRTRVVRIPAVVDVACGAIGIGLFALVVYSGFAGTQTPTANFGPTFIYVTFWVGLVFASLLFGNVFAAFSPWRSAARGVAWVARRLSSGEPPSPLRYPGWLGRWPAALGLLCFAWVELAYQNRDDPSTLALLGLAYAAVQLAGMSFYGIDEWSDRADAFGAYFGVIARLSPWERRDGVLYLRRPLSGVTRLDPIPGTVALLCTSIGTTSFDGFSQGRAWANLANDLQQPFLDLGLSAATALEIASSIGLVGAVLIVSGLYRVGVMGMHTVSRDHPTSELARQFVHTLTPIAVAYVTAHYFSLLAFQGQAMAFLSSDPLGDGSNLFGTATATIDYNVVSAQGIWYVQVGALVIGHVAGLTLAHDKALAVYRSVREATRSQYWMLLVMITFTSLGLWLLSAINNNS
jgi:hypothetical protein